MKTKPIVSYCVLRAAYCELKKQSQFSKVEMDINIYIKGNYEEKTQFGLEKNKAKQTQIASKTNNN